MNLSAANDMRKKALAPGRSPRGGKVTVRNRMRKPVISSKTKMPTVTPSTVIKTAGDRPKDRYKLYVGDKFSHMDDPNAWETGAMYFGYVDGGLGDDETDVDTSPSVSSQLLTSFTDTLKQALPTYLQLRYAQKTGQPPAPKPLARTPSGQLMTPLAPGGVPYQQTIFGLPATVVYVAGAGLAGLLAYKFLGSRRR